MKHLHLFIFFIIIIGILLVKCMRLETFENVSMDYVHPQAKISFSNVGERGVFANSDYKKGDIIEVCPTIKTETDLAGGKVRDYMFRFDNKFSLVAFGFCSMYNHSDKPNVIWEILNENQLQMKATRDIKKGEEIFTTYGEDYWTSRSDYLTKNK